MSEVTNPFLEDDDHEGYEAPTPRAEAPKPTVIVASATTDPRTKRGTPRVRVTNRDAVLLAFLSKFRVATADSLSMLLKAEAFPGKKATGGPTSVDVTRKRLQKMEVLGLVEHDRTWKGELIYGVTKKGQGAAVDFGYLYRPHEADEAGLRGLTYALLPHTLAVSAVAARFASEAEMAGPFSGIPLENLVSEHTLRAAVKPHELRLAKALKKEDPSRLGLNENAERYFWGNYRKGRIDYLIDEAKGDLGIWEASIDGEPELWTLGHPRMTTQNFGAQKHFPDLVIKREEHRRGSKPESFFVEVELTPKSSGGYDTIVTTYAEEFKRNLYARCFYFTNSEHVKNAITRADAKYGYNLVESKRIIFKPILNRDGKLLADGKRIGG